MAAVVTRELVQDYFQACVSRDPKRVADCLHDEVDWSVSGPIDLLPYCGQRHGKSAVVDTVVRLVPMSIRVTGMEVEELLIEGEGAAAFLHVTAIHASTGRTVSYRASQFMRFRDGKLVRSRALIDSFDAAQQVAGRAMSMVADTPLDLTTSGNRVAL